MRVLYVTKQSLFRPSVRYRCHNMVKQLLNSDATIDASVMLHTDVTPQHIRESDVVIFHRILSNEPFFQWALNSNTLVGVDFDDLTFLPHHYEQTGGHRTNPDRNLQKFLKEYRHRFELICMADFVTVSSSELQDRLAALGISSHIVRNCIASDIPLPEIRLEKEGLKNILFMSGTITHDEDLKLIARVMEVFLTKHPDVTWTILGSIVKMPENLKKLPNVKRVELLEFDELPQFISQFDLNVFSLEDTVFNDCKSALKFYESGFAGVPTLASPRREFRQAITDGVNGFLAETEKEWLDKLEYIYANPQVLSDVAKAAYEYVQKNYTTNYRGDSYANLLKELVSENEAKINKGKTMSNTNEVEVSVVMTSYNHGKFVGAAIESVLSQDHPSFEFIIVDDRSTDNSVEVIESFKDPRIIFEQNETNVGMVTGVNKGIRRARGKYIAHMNSDDIWTDPSKLSRQVEYLEEHPECGAVFTRVELIDEESKPIVGENKFNDNRAANKTKDRWLNQFYLGRNRFCYPTAMVRKSVFDEVGLYDPRLSILLDLDMWVRICMNHEMYILEDVYTAFRKGENSYSYIYRQYVDLEYSKVYEHYLKMSYEKMMEVFGNDFAKVYRDKADRINKDNYKIAFMVLGLKQVQRHWMFVVPNLHELFKHRDYPELGQTYRHLHGHYKRYMDRHILRNDAREDGRKPKPPASAQAPAAAPKKEAKKKPKLKILKKLKKLAKAKKIA